MEEAGIFYGHSAYFTASWCMLWAFGIYVWLFGMFWYFVPRKIWQPCFPRVAVISFVRKVVVSVATGLNFFTVSLFSEGVV
jgi:hypothetical protein